jgi:hypothetical protein
MKRLLLIFTILSLLIFLISCESDLGNSSKVNTGFNSNCNKSSVINITVLGKGAPPVSSELSEVQKYLFAERAAILDGYRLISERLSGIILKSASNSKNFSIISDNIKTITNSFMKGIKVVSIKHNDNGVCEALMEMNISNKEISKLLTEPYVEYLKTCNLK